MGVARHQRPKELEGTPIDEIANRYIGRFHEKKPDWAAFEDAKIEGFKRAQHRFIGAGGSGKHNDPTVIPARNFTLSIMFVEPGQGNAAHTHEVEEVFFVLRGKVKVMVEKDGERWESILGERDCISVPPGVYRGEINVGEEDAIMMVMIGSPKPVTPTYPADHPLAKVKRG